MNDQLTILEGHCLERLRELPAESVHCVVTSPPYWGLRDYGLPDVCWPTGWKGQHGLEPSFELYVEHEVAIFREVRRVLRKDGTCWINLGDCYSASGCGGDTGRSGLAGTAIGQQLSKKAKQSAKSYRRDRAIVGNEKHRAAAGLPAKNLVGIPWRVAFALQADGWFLRADVIWHKPNPMPEAVTDRPTKSHEYIFLLSKSPRYFYDQEAIKEPSSPDSHARSLRANKAYAPPGQSAHRGVAGNRERGVNPKADQSERNGSKQNRSFSAVVVEAVANRNKRSVWTVTTAAFKEAHFATFPPDLIRPCILAGTSAAGACEECGAPYVRLVEKGEADLDHQRACGGDAEGQYNGAATKDYASGGAQNASEVKARILQGMRKRKTVGWQKSCDCQGEKVKPCVVLDPFGGSFTTAAVAIEEARAAIVCELKADYVEIGKRRCQITPGLALA